MSGCDRVIEVEDLVLGLVQSNEAAALAAHVETCVDCKEAREMFLEERALFAARPATAVEPPPLVLPKPSIARLYRFVPALAAVAACMAFFISRPHAADDCDPPAPVAVTTITSDETMSLNVPAICRAPSDALGSPAPAVSLASQDPAACVPSPNATCDVTFSTAMP